MGTIGELVSAGQRFSVDVTQLEVWASITIRRDLGHKNKNLKQDDLLSLSSSPTSINTFIRRGSAE